MSEQVPAIPPGTQPSDLISTINDRLRKINLLLGSTATAGTSPSLTYGTHALRLARPVADYPDGSIFYENDRDNIAYQMRARVWVFAGGIYKRTQAQLSALAATLTANDTGCLVNVTDYAHLLRWTGAAWSWGPGDAGSGMMGLFEVDPGTGWALYNGSSVNYLKSDGSTASVTLPDLTTVAGNAAYPKAGSPNGGPNGAVAPTVTNPGTTGTGNAALGAPSTTTTNVAVTGATTVASSTHVHTDAGHTHTIGAPTVGTNGEPRNLVRRPFFRQ